MQITSAFLIGTHPYSFRCGEPAEIIGVKMVAPDGKETRPCFEVKFSDGFIDYTPIEDEKNYTILSFGGIVTDKLK